MDQYKMFFIQAFTWTPNMRPTTFMFGKSPKTYQICKVCMQKIKLITKIPVELKDITQIYQEFLIWMHKVTI